VNDLDDVVSLWTGRIGNSYERTRARALLLLLRYTAPPISDAATLAKDRVQNERIYLRTHKTGGLVFLKILENSIISRQNATCPSRSRCRQSPVDPYPA
jgi:hypothetical protein